MNDTPGIHVLPHREPDVTLRAPDRSFEKLEEKPIMIARSLSLALVVLTALSHADDKGVKDDKAAARDELFAQAKSLSTQEKWADAISRLREFTRKYPGDARASEARFWLGFCLVKSDEFEEALRELEPFEHELAQDKWADDALLQLGHAYRGQDNDERALECWKQLLDKHPESVWKTEAVSQIVDLLFHGSKDCAACLPYCERAVRDTADLDSITEPRYAGAYCLVALGRNDEADHWMDRWFKAVAAVEAGWRRVIIAQRDLRMGRTEQALQSLDALDADFPDLDRRERLDLTLRAASMLNREQHSARARDLLIARVKASAGDSQEDISELIDLLAEATDEEGAFRDTLDRLASDASLPLMTRVAVRERLVQALRDDDRSEQAQSLLREDLAKEKAEYPLFRVATLLAEVLNEDRDDRPGALKVLNEVLPRLHRHDLVSQMRAALKDLQSPSDDKDN
jgi:outer membrane protein assembly factor BamD (BamD/ComL family)